MIRRSLCALALVSALSTSAGAKPPDLPMNETITVTPKVEPPVEYAPPLNCGVLIFQQTECDSHWPDEMAEFLAKGFAKEARTCLANDVKPYAHPFLTPIVPSEIYRNNFQEMPYYEIRHNSLQEETPWEEICRKNIQEWYQEWYRENYHKYSQGAPYVEVEEQPRVVQGLAEEELPPARTIYDVLPESLPTPAVYQLRPTARNRLASSLLLSVNPLLALLRTDWALDAPHDHPQKVAGDDVLSDIPSARQPEGFQGEFGSAVIRASIENQEVEKWLMSHWAARHATPSPEENEGYIHVIMPTAVASLTPVDTPVEEIDVPLVPAVEALPMPKEDTPADGVTCPYLRQQALDRHACPIADPEIGRGVLDNLERLTKADKLVELANEFARAGRIIEAMHCCLAAADLCPGSPSAARAADMLIELCFGSHEPANDTEESAETSNTPPGVEQQVNGLMKACRLLMNEGQHEQAAELARQAYALDPERVMADPLIYKMHLLADTPAKHPAGACEESEPPSCPYCPVGGKPIREIVPDKKKSESGPTTFLVPPLPKVDYEVVPALERVQAEKAAGAEEASEEQERSGLDPWIEAALGGPGKLLLGFGFGRDGGLRLCGECSCAGSVYHVLYSQGTLALWKTPDAAKIKP